MKAFFLILITIALAITSCTKPDDEIPTVPVGQTNNNNTDWSDEYGDGGTLPNGGSQNNALVGTKWVLTKYRNGLGWQYTNDTLLFKTNTIYTVNSGGDRTYSLTSVTGSTNKNLNLNFFMPFGGSNYTGTVGYYFVSDAVINNCEFTDLQNSSIKIVSYFKKI